MEYLAFFVVAFGLYCAYGLYVSGPATRRELRERELREGPPPPTAEQRQALLEMTLNDVRTARVRAEQLRAEKRPGYRGLSIVVERWESLERGMRKQGAWTLAEFDDRKGWLRDVTDLDPDGTLGLWTPRPPKWRPPGARPDDPPPAGPDERAAVGPDEPPAVSRGRLRRGPGRRRKEPAFTVLSTVGPFATREDAADAASARNRELSVDRRGDRYWIEVETDPGLWCIELREEKVGLLSRVLSALFTDPGAGPY